MNIDHYDDDALLAWFTGISEAAEARYPVALRSHEYGGAPEQCVDWWGDPDAGVVVVSVHGGYFAAPYDRSVNEPVSRRLAAEGFLVANVDYRRAGSCSHPMETVRDVRDACAHAVEVAAGRPVVVVGHSAGGYLCLVASTVPGVTAVVPLAPVTQLAATARGGWDEGAIEAWIGCPPTEPLWQELELAAVGFADLPTHVIHGVDDRVVPFAHSEEFARVRSGVRLTGLDATGHYEFLDPGSAAIEVTVEAVRGLVP